MGPGVHIAVRRALGTAASASISAARLREARYPKGTVRSDDHPAGSISGGKGTFAFSDGNHAQYLLACGLDGGASTGTTANAIREY